MKGIVSNIQLFSISDGPGIRSTLFMQGCNLRCGWCHNPETIPQNPVLLYNPRLCIQCGQCVKACPNKAHEIRNGIHIFRRDLCTLAGKCALVCPTNALKISGRCMGVAEVMEILLEDKAFYESSGGGVTISGGEPLLQAPFVSEIAKECKRNDIHVIIDTAASMSFSPLEQLIPYTDIFYIDIKSGCQDAYIQILGGNLNLVLENMAKLIERGRDIVARIPLIPGFNNTQIQGRKIASLLQKVGANKVDILPFHRMGSGKYAAMGQIYGWEEYKPPEKSTIKEFADIFLDQGFECRIDG